MSRYLRGGLCGYRLYIHDHQFTSVEENSQGKGAAGGADAPARVTRWSAIRGQLDQSVSKMAGVLFEDIFNVKDIDPEGKKFDRGECLLTITFRCVRSAARIDGTRATSS